MTPATAQLEAALRPYLLRRRLLDAAAGLLQGLTLAGVLAAALVLVLGRLALAAPIVAGALTALALAPALVRLIRPPDAMAAALAVERSFPWLQDRVATAIDLARARPTRARHSERIAARISAEAAAALRDLPFARALPLNVLRTHALVAILGLGLAALAWSALPDAARDARAIAPGPAISERVEPATPIPPALTDLSLSITPPAYTRLPARRVTDIPETIRAPQGSAITIAGRCQRAGATTSLAMEPGGTRDLPRAEGGRVKHSFTLARTVRWRLRAEDAAGIAMTGWCVLEPVPDAMPTVRLLRPDGDLTLDVAGPIEVAVAAGDDYGIAALGLRYRLGDADRWQSLPLEASAGSATARLNVGAVGLRPGGELLLRAYAMDNDAVTGPKTALSAPVRIHLRADATVPLTPQTPAQEAQREEADALEQLRRAAAEFAEQLTQALESASASAAGGEQEPAVGRELQEAARRLQEQAGRLESAMHEAGRQLTASEMLTPELVEKVRELHELMREVLDEEMRRALEELQRALEAQDLAQMRMSLERAREAQERFMQRLEQTLSLLRRARLEALVEQLRRRAEELARRQEELGERTEEMPEGSAAEARQAERDQQALARNTEPLAGEIEQAVEVAREVADEMAVELGAIADRLLREDPAGSMRRAASALGRGSPSAARDPQDQALHALRQAAAALAELSEQLASDFTADTRRQIARMIRDALALSAGQEDLGEDVGRLATLRSMDLVRDKRAVDPVRRRQSTLADGASALAERMLELAQQTPAMDPALAGAAVAIAEEMAQAAREIEGADVGTATWRGRAAMAGLNEIARRLLEVDEQLASSSAQSTLSDYMRRLQQLAQRQQGLNEQTGQAQSGRQPGRAPGPNLSELALEQAMIREALQQMLQQGGEATQPIADQLGGVPDEMEQVEEEMRSGRIERETVERQERILERMLEAQRSLYTREQERSERQAERPSAWEPPPSPPALSPSLLRAPSVMVRPGAGAEALPRGYEELVREYFRALGEGGP